MEVPVDLVESALNAEKGGASRVELCSSLSEGGLTPSIGLFQVVKRLLKIPVFAMLRPNAGPDFIYTEEELEAIKFDAANFRTLGADGLVFGILTKDRLIDVEACEEILKIAGPLPCTFHRAFDICENPVENVKLLRELGFKRILTSGCSATAFSGLTIIKECVLQSKNEIIVVPGCGVNRFNAEEILITSGAKEIHASAATILQIPQNKKLKFNNNPDGTLKITCAEHVRTIVNILENTRNISGH